MQNIHIKKIRSFVLRKGRITKNQEISIKNNWLSMGINYVKKKINFNEIFKNKNDIIIEIGFGMGISLVNMASNNKKNNFIGIEVYKPGVGSCLNYAKKYNIKNLRIICHDAIEVLEYMIEDNSLNIIQLFFPDPWHKKKHNKRRIIQLDFINLVLKKLKFGGFFHIATDCQKYYKYILNIVKKTSNLINASQEKISINMIKSRPITKFENRGIKLGNTIKDIILKKI